MRIKFGISLLFGENEIDCSPR
jgi:hypothetical protein